MHTPLLDDVCAAVETSLALMASLRLLELFCVAAPCLFPREAVLLAAAAAACLELDPSDLESLSSRMTRDPFGGIVRAVEIAGGLSS